MGNMRSALSVTGWQIRECYPASVLWSCLHLAVVRSRLSASPSVGGAAAAARDVAQHLFPPEAVRLQRA
jgi:hypothetical protein